MIELSCDTPSICLFLLLHHCTRLCLRCICVCVHRIATPTCPPRAKNLDLRLRCAHTDTNRAHNLHFFLICDTSRKEGVICTVAQNNWASIHLQGLININDSMLFFSICSRNENSPNFHPSLRKGVAKYYLKLLQYTILYHVFLLYRGTDLDVVNRP